MNTVISGIEFPKEASLCKPLSKNPPLVICVCQKNLINSIYSRLHLLRGCFCHCLVGVHHGLRSNHVAEMGEDVVALGFPLGQNSLKISKGALRRCLVFASTDLSFKGFMDAKDLLFHYPDILILILCIELF